jgi:hypothetical protein
MKQLTTTLTFALLLAGCSATYVDDKHNYERTFGIKCPKDVEVIHSYYYRSPHFTEEHEYYFQMTSTSGSNLLKMFILPNMVQATDENSPRPFFLGLRPNRPEWFAPEAVSNYEIWYCTNQTHVLLGDKQTKILFVYGSMGM